MITLHFQNIFSVDSTMQLQLTVTETTDPLTPEQKLYKNKKIKKIVVMAD